MSIFVLTCRRCGIKLIGRSTVSERDAFICPECRKLIAKPSQKTRRQTIFRLLAGILAPLILWALLSQNPPLRTAIGGVLVVIVFAVFAIFGTSAADFLLSAFYGIETNTTKNSDPQDNAENE